jgi:hypothetical protein
MAYNEKYKRILHRLGYYDYQRGLIYRHLAQGDGWNDHLQNCRNFIIRSVDTIQPDRVTVLGSGWLLDLPLKEMLEKTGSVTLIDIIHPPDAVRQVADLNNVELVEADATGGLIEEIWQKAGRLPFYSKLRTLEGINIPDFDLPGDPGLVISLNILSQLESLPLKLLRAKSSAGEGDYLMFRKDVQQKHLDFLLRHQSVLITDTGEVFTGRDGVATEVRTVEIDLPEGQYSEKWVWDFDLKGSDYFEKKSVMKVSAILL